MQNDLNAKLSRAAEAGLIKPDQLGPLLNFLDTQEAAFLQPGAPDDNTNDEELKFIRNFHDIFLSMGVVFLGIGMIIYLFMSMDNHGSRVGDFFSAAMKMGGISMLCGAAMWGLAEFFAKRKRLLLSSMACCVFIALFSIFATACLSAMFFKSRVIDYDFITAAPNILLFMLLPLPVIALFYWRFRLPFSLAVLGVLGTIWVACAYRVVQMLLGIPLERSADMSWGVILFAGICCFVAALHFDARDPERTMRYSDNAFWLHFVAAPLILYGARGLIDPFYFEHIFQKDQSDLLQAGGMLALIALFSFVSVLINRRALVVSALLTTAIAMGTILNSVGLGSYVVPAVFALLGSIVLLFGSNWHALRRALFRRFPPKGVWVKYFPPEPEKSLTKK